MSDFKTLSIQQIKQFLEKKSGTTHDLPTQWNERECKQAAVLIPFVQLGDEWQLVFIRRASHEKDFHSGQVAFPGGKYEPQDDNLQTTALRETHEEIGVSPVDVTLLGELDHHHSISRFRITPVVAHIPWPYELSLDEQEVARVFCIPLSWLANPLNYQTKYRSIEGREIPVVYFNEYDGELLWGATARMTLSLISLLK